MLKRIEETNISSMSVSVAGTDVARQPNAATIAGKHVLLLDFDLYKNIGGGQSSYKRLIARCPENTYYYFVREEPIDRLRPPNARAIPFKEAYFANVGDLPAEMMHFYEPYLQAWQLAASARVSLGRLDFDVVDGPDYRCETLFIRGALAHHGMGCGAVALAMHGTISNVFRDEWSGRAPDPRMMAELRARERLQYRSADIRYGMSGAYLDEWQQRAGLDANLIDPLCMVAEFEPMRPEPSSAPVDLAYIGRRERCKGPDLFADIVWCLRAGSYGRVRMIGPDAFGHSGVGSVHAIDTIATNRGLKLQLSEGMTPAALDELYRSRTVVVLPARYETFNLVMLEALRLGCPVFIGQGAGIAPWIRHRLPALSDLILDVSCARTAAASVRKAVEGYDDYRARVVEVLRSAGLEADTASLGRMYDVRHGAARQARQTLFEIEQRFDSFNRPRELSDLPARLRLLRSVRRSTPRPVKKLLRVGRRVRAALVLVRHPHLFPRRMWVRAASARVGLSPRAMQQVKIARDIEGTRHALLARGERTRREIANKLHHISSELHRTQLARVQIFSDMARLERKRRTGDLIAAAYQLRVMRWLGEDRFKQLDFVCQTLRENNFVKEAEVAEAMFAGYPDGHVRCRAILDSQYAEQLTKPDLPLTILDDRRGTSSAKVAVISSLYNAEKKLKTLLDNVSAQSMARAGQVEIVLVDSNSPTNEYEVFKAFAAASSIPVVFARSEARETIQAAWNRGIKLARASYVCFLGADEGMHPDCLEQLDQCLDGNPEVDWAIADSIVTNVDKRGVLSNDIMVYNRGPYDHLMVYLDTCYLNYVGGLYRKSIHDRFGYYDETFRAAGDTEFKLRIAKHIKSKHVPRALGVFNNYPEERTTQHPRAEIEDLRAWYLHRSAAGMEYLLDRQPVEAVENLFRHALSYRKSYLRYISTDFDLANAIGAAMKNLGGGPFADKALASTGAMLKRLRMLEMLDFRAAPHKRQRLVISAVMAARAQEAQDRDRFQLAARPQYEIFNDNRYEQHCWSWSA